MILQRSFCASFQSAFIFNFFNGQHHLYLYLSISKITIWRSNELFLISPPNGRGRLLFTPSKPSLCDFSKLENWPHRVCSLAEERRNKRKSKDLDEVVNNPTRWPLKCPLPIVLIINKGLDEEVWAALRSHRKDVAGNERPLCQASVALIVVLG